MECTTVATIKSIIRKVSQSNNIYHEISITEKVKLGQDKVEQVERDWNRLYYPHDIDKQAIEDVMGKEAEITIVFYPVKVTRGDKEYDNINCHVERIKSL